MTDDSDIKRLSTSSLATLSNIDSEIQHALAAVEADLIEVDDEEGLNDLRDQIVNLLSDKVDRVGAFLAGCEATIEGLEKRLVAVKKLRDGLRTCITRTLEARDTPLEGMSWAFALQTSGGKRALDIHDPTSVPSEYKNLKITITEQVPMHDLKTQLYWLSCLNRRKIASLEEATPDELARFRNSTETVILTEPLRQSLESGDDVPGATLKARGRHLRVKAGGSSKRLPPKQVEAAPEGHGNVLKITAGRRRKESE